MDQKPSWAFRPCWWLTFRSQRERKEKEKREGKEKKERKERKRRRRGEKREIGQACIGVLVERVASVFVGAA